MGKSILFARVDDGRVSLVRFGPLVQFDTETQHHLFDGDKIETAAFSRAIVVRASRRGMLPRRG